MLKKLAVGGFTCPYNKICRDFRLQSSLELFHGKELCHCNRHQKNTTKEANACPNKTWPSFQELQSNPCLDLQGNPGTKKWMIDFPDVLNSFWLPSREISHPAPKSQKIEPTSRNSGISNPCGKDSVQKLDAKRRACLDTICSDQWWLMVRVWDRKIVHIYCSIISGRSIGMFKHYAYSIYCIHYRNHYRCSERT